MSDTNDAAELVVDCDGDMYEVSRAAGVTGAAAGAPPCWVVRARGYVVGKFPVTADQTDAQIRDMACQVIRHGSTTTFPCPPES